MMLTRKNTDGFCVLSIEGRITTANFNSLEKELTEIIDGGQINIILNCKDLTYISSSGLRVFLIAQKRISRLNGKLFLCEMQAAIQEIFDISGFSNIFEIYPAELSALEA